MDISGYVNNSQYFNASDFPDQPTNWKIASINSEIIGRDDPAEKPVLEVYDANGNLADRRLPLNKTNARNLQKAYGNNTDDWVGRPIRICSIWVSFQGKQVQGICIMPGVVAMRATAGAGSTRTSSSAARALQEDLDDAIPF